MEKTQPFTVLLGVIALALVGMLVFQVYAFNKGNEKDLSFTSVDESAIQAVFLSDGQIYFGDISSIDSTTLTLKNIFYLQVNQNLQATEEGAAETTEGENALSLAKLGTGELHGPTDTMVVNRDHVLFWENLQETSKVTKAIREYKPE